METTENYSSNSSRRRSSFSNDNAKEVVIAPNAGACFGVVRAVKLGQQAAIRGQTKKSPVFALGALVHYPATIAALEAAGVKIVDNSDEISGGTVILRSHGIRQEIEKDLRTRGIGIVDATCPLVKKPQRIAQSLSEKGYYLVLVGDVKHPEVKGVLSYYNKETCLVTYDPSDIDHISDSVEKVGVIAQTTIEAKVFDEVVERCKSRFKEVAAYNTICDATSIRQGEALDLSKHADLMIVVGGKTSSNTNKLAKICRNSQPNTYMVESLEEIDPNWLKDKTKVGVTGGAATPQEYVDLVGDYVVSLMEKMQ